MRHPHHYKISIALAISAGAWGIYWLPQRILEDGGLTGGWGTISQMMIGTLLLLPIAIWKLSKNKGTGLELPGMGILIGGGFILYAIRFLLTDVVRALIMFYMTPVWTTIFEIIFLKKKHGWQRILSLSDYETHKKTDIFSNYLNQEDAEQNLNPTNFFKNTEDSFEDVSDELIRKEE